MSLVMVWRLAPSAGIKQSRLFVANAHTENVFKDGVKQKRDKWKKEIKKRRGGREALKPLTSSLCRTQCLSSDALRGRWRANRHITEREEAVYISGWRVGVRV